MKPTKANPDEQEVLRLVVEGTVSETGTEFFRALVKHLSVALPERTYVIQRASVLEPGSWSNISQPLTPDASGALFFEDPVSPLPSQGFYRVMELE